MVLAGRAGDTALDEDERRLGGMRIATKYPRTAERHFEETGRAERAATVPSIEIRPIAKAGCSEPSADINFLLGT